MSPHATPAIPAVTARTRDGTEVRLRPLGRGERDLVAGFFAGLSEDSRRRRFLQPTPRLSEAMLRHLVDVDGRRHAAIVAEVGGECAGIARFIARAPRQFAEVLGKLLFWCGEDKIIYGSETPIWHPRWALEAFWDFQLPQDLVEGYGYPQLTEQAKRKILGENLLRLHGMDVEATRARLRA